MDGFAVIATMLVGFGSGILSGAFGVGGAVLTTPGIRFLGATPIEAVGSTIPAILPASMSGAWRYSRAGLVDWRVALFSGLTGSGFAVLGAQISDRVNAHYLMLATAALLLMNAIGSLRRPSEAVQTPELSGGGGLATAVRTAAPSLTAIAIVGAASGMLAGLLGIGGGILMVPAFTRFLKIVPKRAVATSLVSVAIFSVPAMVTHAALGHINWAFALALMVGVIPGAQVGAHLTIGGSDTRLRMLTALFFGALALAYGISELLAL